MWFHIEKQSGKNWVLQSNKQNQIIYFLMMYGVNILEEGKGIAKKRKQKTWFLWETQDNGTMGMYLFFDQVAFY